MSNLASNALNKWTYKKLSYDPDAFATIGLMGTSAFYIVVRPDSPFKSVSDLVNTANKSSESLKYGSLGTGGAAHLVTELFRSKAGIKDLLHIPYKTGASLDLMAGRLDFMVDASVVNQIKTGQLRALAVATPKRWPTLPEIPTTAEAGLPDVTMQSFIGLSAPAGTPVAILEKLNKAIRDVVSDPENENRILALHAQPMRGTRQEANDFIKQTSEKWRPVIQSLKISFED